MTPRVLALTRYDSIGASSRVRFLQYIPDLERRGLRVSVQRLFSDAYLTRLYAEGRRSPAELSTALMSCLWTVLRKARADVIWLQQELFPYLPAVLEIALLTGRPVVIDFDDAYHLYYQGLRSSFARSLYSGKVAALMRAAAAVTVGNETLAAYARDAGAQRVEMVYSAVDTARFTAVARPHDGAFAVGWIGTPMTAAQSLHILREPLKQFLGETSTECLFVGMAEDQFPDLRGRRIPWSEAAEADFLGAISAGLCPLDDSPWTRGKSGYKIIQYFSAGRPALVSPVGIAANLVEPGATGFHCRSEDDWYRALTTLAADRRLCVEMGSEARRRAETRYDSRIAAAEIHRIFTSLM